MERGIALFGEAERGEFQKGYFCQNLSELSDCAGNPPPESRGIYYATQALLYHYPLLFFRVKEEGFSQEDYLKGLSILSESTFLKNISAICTPGVGDQLIIRAVFTLCLTYKQVLITNEKDLFDFLHS